MFDHSKSDIREKRERVTIRLKQKLRWAVQREIKNSWRVKYWLRNKPKRHDDSKFKHPERESPSSFSWNPVISSAALLFTFFFPLLHVATLYKL